MASATVDYRVANVGICDASMSAACKLVLSSVEATVCLSMQHALRDTKLALTKDAYGLLTLGVKGFDLAKLKVASCSGRNLEASTEDKTHSQSGQSVGAG